MGELRPVDCAETVTLLTYRSGVLDIGEADKMEHMDGNHEVHAAFPRASATPRVAVIQ